MRKLLFISAERLGDTLFLTPALAFAREHAPDVKIDVIAVTPLAGDVLANNATINKLFIEPDQVQLEKISDDYDAVLIPHPSPEAKLYAKQIRAKVVENPYIRELIPSAEKAIKFMANVLNIEWSGEPIPYQLFPQPKDEENVKALLVEKGIELGVDKIIAMHIGCHALSKKHSSWFGRAKHSRAWPLKKFIALSKRLLSDYPKAKIILTGSKAEVDLANTFKNKIPQSISLVNETNLQQLAAFFKHTDLFLCSDTGTLHVACAVKAKLLGLYLASNVLNNAPYPPSKRFVMLQDDDLSKLPVNVVYDAVQALLSSE